MNGYLYNVRIRFKEKFDPTEFRLKLTLDYLEKVIVAPYRNGDHIMLDGRIIAPDEIWSINIKVIHEPPSNPSLWQRLMNSFWYSGPREAFEGEGADVTDEFIHGPPGAKLTDPQPDEQGSRPPKGTRDVFVVHGRNEQARKAMFEFLRSIDLNPLEWSVAVQATDKASPYIGEILDAAFSRAQAVVVLFTPDDEARLKEAFWSENEPSHETELTGQARPNVLFEAGMAMGRSEERTILVELGTLRPFSDVAGRFAIRPEKSPVWRRELAKRLETAGCQVDLDGSDWMSAGDFDDVLESVVQGSSESQAVVDEESTVAETPRLSDKAKELLIEAAEDSVGIRRFNSVKGVVILINGKRFGDADNRQSMAEYEEALNQLIDFGLVDVPWNSGGGLLRVTNKGVEFVKALKDHD